MMTLGPCFWEVGGWVLDVKILGLWSRSRADLTAQAYQKNRKCSSNQKKIGCLDKANKQAARHKQCTFVRKKQNLNDKNLCGWPAMVRNTYSTSGFLPFPWRKKETLQLSKINRDNMFVGKNEEGCKYIKIT